MRRHRGPTRREIRGLGPGGGRRGYRPAARARAGLHRRVRAHSDLLAIGAITALRQRGLRVPADVSVVGYDDIPVARFVEPALGTMRQPMREVGRTALTVLLDGQQGPVQRRGPDLLPDRPLERRLDPPGTGPHSPLP